MVDITFADKPTNMAVPQVSWLQLKAILNYHPTTGQFLWGMNRGKRPAGTEAGSLVRGVPYIRIQGVLMRSADIAHFWMNGSWKHMRPKNGNQQDTRWDNLEVYQKSEPQNDGDKWLYASKVGGEWAVQGNLVPQELLDKLRNVLNEKVI